MESQAPIQQVLGEVHVTQREVLKEAVFNDSAQKLARIAAAEGSVHVLSSCGSVLQSVSSAHT